MRRRVGIANTLGRIFAGFLADFEHVSALLLHNFGLVGGGLLCILSAFATNYVTLCIFCICFGVCYGEPRASFGKLLTTNLVLFEIPKFVRYFKFSAATRESNA